ncbi:MAG: cytochrome c oxidase subunit [Acidimicrobiaceae bacterium]|nr:cytochrome c oxidase subunit [Acidimicrobiaceae bacterium]
MPLFLLGGALVLGGCNAPTFGAFRGATVQGKDEFKLWVGMVIAGIIVAIIVWALIFWSIVRYRRRRSDEIPRQFHSSLLLEIVYTAVPIVIVGFIFYFTVVTENEVDAVSTHPAETIHAVAYRWGWRFIYQDGNGRSQGVIVQTGAEPALLAQSPNSPLYPRLVLPDHSTVRIVLTSPDVVHELYVPAFNFGRNALPGHPNVFDFTTTTTGIFQGHCAEYCGLYHAEMLFSVKVEAASQFQQWLTAQQSSQAQSGAAS